MIANENMDITRDQWLLSFKDWLSKYEEYKRKKLKFDDTLNQAFANLQFEVTNVHMLLEQSEKGMGNERAN
jgi:hypothetical protein